MKLSRIIAGVAIAAALAAPAPVANAFTPPAGGATGTCTIRGTVYGKAKAAGQEVPFTSQMCPNVLGTFTPGGSSNAVFDPATNTGGGAPAPSTGTPAPSTGGGTTTPPASGGGASMPNIGGGTAGVCTINGTKYGSAKMGTMSKNFDENMCKMVQGTFAAGERSTAVFDASTVAPPAGGTAGSAPGGAGAPTTGGSLGSLIGGGSVPGVCKAAGVSYAKVEAMPGQVLPFVEMMCKGLPGGEWVAGGTGTATLSQDALR